MSPYGASPNLDCRCLTSRNSHDIWLKKPTEIARPISEHPVLVPLPRTSPPSSTNFMDFGFGVASAMWYSMVQCYRPFQLNSTRIFRRIGWWEHHEEMWCVWHSETEIFTQKCFDAKNWEVQHPLTARLVRPRQRRRQIATNASRQKRCSDDRREKPGTAIATKQQQNRPETSESIQKLNSEIFRVDSRWFPGCETCHHGTEPEATASALLWTGGMQPWLERCSECHVLTWTNFNLFGDAGMLVWWLEVRIHVMFLSFHVICIRIAEVHQGVGSSSQNMVQSQLSQDGQLAAENRHQSAADNASSASGESICPWNPLSDPDNGDGRHAHRRWSHCNLADQCFASTHPRKVLENHGRKM